MFDKRRRTWREHSRRTLKPLVRFLVDHPAALLVATWEHHPWTCETTQQVERYFPFIHTTFQRSNLVLVNRCKTSGSTGLSLCPFAGDGVNNGIFIGYIDGAKIPVYVCNTPYQDTRHSTSILQTSDPRRSPRQARLTKFSTRCPIAAKEGPRDVKSSRSRFDQVKERKIGN